MCWRSAATAAIAVAAVLFLAPGVRAAGDPAFSSQTFLLDEGTLLPWRPYVNFLGAGVSCVDNPAAKQSQCTITGGGGGGGTPVAVDLGDNGSHESAGIDTIATTGDTTSIFTVPSAAKLVVDVTKAWPQCTAATTATSATTAATATSATTAGTATALAANGANCGAGSFPLGVDAQGAVETCSTSLAGNAATATALAADGANCAAGSFPLGVSATGAVQSCSTSISGTAATATALAANGANCGAGTFPLGVDAAGAVESCSSSLAGNATTATALAANGANCGAGAFPLGVDAAGAVEGCSSNLAGNAATATALAANGANCSAGSFPLGVDASGAVESCSTSLSGNAATATTASGLSCADCVALTTQTTGNYVQDAAATGGLVVSTPEGGSVRLKTCATGEIVKSTGVGTWDCAADATSSSSGTVTSVAGGAGIATSPAPITTTGTVALDYTATLGSPAFGAGEARFGAGGLLFEGTTAGGGKTLLLPEDPTVANRTVQLPNESGMLALGAGVQTANTVGYWSSARALTGDKALQVVPTAGELDFGPPAGPSDVRLYRPAAGRLRTETDFEAATQVLTPRVQGGTASSSTLTLAPHNAAWSAANTGRIRCAERVVILGDPQTISAPVEGLNVGGGQVFALDNAVSLFQAVKFAPELNYSVGPVFGLPPMLFVNNSSLRATASLTMAPPLTFANYLNIVAGTGATFTMPDVAIGAAGVMDSPTFRVEGSGVFDLAATYTGMQSALAVQAGAVLNLRRGFSVLNGGGAGGIGTQVGLDIAALTKGSTANMSIRSAGGEMRHTGPAIFGTSGVATAPAARLHVQETTPGAEVFRIETAGGGGSNPSVRWFQVRGTAATGTTNIDFALGTAACPSGAVCVVRATTVCHCTSGTACTTNQGAVQASRWAVKNHGGTVGQIGVAAASGNDLGGLTGLIDGASVSSITTSLTGATWRTTVVVPANITHACNVTFEVQPTTT